MSPRRSPNSLRLLLLAICASLSSSCTALLGTRAEDPAPVVRGPLPTRNQHPVSLTFLHMRPRRAVALEPGQWEASVQGAYTSIYEAEVGAGQTVQMDGEIAHTAVRLRRGLGAHTDLEVEFAAAFASGGFLDSVVNHFHDWFGLPDQGRSDTEDDQNAMVLRRRGREIYALEEDTVGFGDVPVVLTHQIRVEDERGAAVAVRAGVELPTGDEDQGFGNGALDYGFGVLAERTRGRWTFTGALDVTFTGQPDAWSDADVEANDLGHVQFGVEYRWHDRLSLLGQLFLTSGMTDDYDIEEFGTEIFDLAIGAAWGGPTGARWFAAFQEDLIAATGPDFGVAVGVTWGF